VGAIVTPLLVPWIALNYGWRWAFISIGLAGLVWIPLWLFLYRRPAPFAGPADGSSESGWLTLLVYRQTWALLIARFLTDPVWWFYLFWGPKFLQSRFGLRLDQIGPPLVCIYLLSTAGGLLGGWLPSLFLKHGLARPRDSSHLASALLVAPLPVFR
jgi:ACS family hexuronate transporter-like MFS transporter